jgi:hypothetical protein
LKVRAKTAAYSIAFTEHCEKSSATRILWKHGSPAKSGRMPGFGSDERPWQEDGCHLATDLFFIGRQAVIDLTVEGRLTLTPIPD